MLSTILTGLFISACFVLVVVVLLQPGKADAGALFSSSISSTAFGPRGTQTILAKITIGAAASFMLLALALSIPGLSGPRSVLQSQPAEATPTPAPSPVSTPVPAASVQQPAANTNVAPSPSPAKTASPPAKKSK